MRVLMAEGSESNERLMDGEEPVRERRRGREEEEKVEVLDLVGEGG